LLQLVIRLFLSMAWHAVHFVPKYQSSHCSMHAARPEAEAFLFIACDLDVHP
jgi:hypothetical protein